MDAVSSQIAGLYEAVLEPGRLTTTIDSIWRSMGCEIGSIMTIDYPSGRLIDLVAQSSNFDTRSAALYQEHYSAQNTWFCKARHHSPPYVVRGHELVDDAAFARTEFCVDWCSRVGIFHLLGGMHSIGEGRAVASAVYRPREEGGFDDEQKRRFEALAPHLARALQISERLGLLAGQRQFGLDLLDHLDLGVILLDVTGRPVLMNAIAGRLVRRQSWLISRAGELRPARLADASGFRKLVGDAARTSLGEGLETGGVLRLGDAEGRVLPVLVAPFRLPQDPGAPWRAMVAVMFANPERLSPLNTRMLARVLGLSQREGSIVAALASGKTLVQYAEDADVSVNTAKTQLAAISDKTGHSKQASLVAAVMSDPVVRMASRTMSED